MCPSDAATLPGSPKMRVGRGALSTLSKGRVLRASAGRLWPLTHSLSCHALITLLLSPTCYLVYGLALLAEGCLLSDRR